MFGKVPFVIAIASAFRIEPFYQIFILWPGFTPWSRNGFILHDLCYILFSLTYFFRAEFVPLSL